MILSPPENVAGGSLQLCIVESVYLAFCSLTIEQASGSVERSSPGCFFPGQSAWGRAARGGGSVTNRGAGFVEFSNPVSEMRLTVLDKPLMCLPIVLAVVMRTFD